MDLSTSNEMLFEELWVLLCSMINESNIWLTGYVSESVVSPPTMDMQISPEIIPNFFTSHILKEDFAYLAIVVWVWSVKKLGSQKSCIIIDEACDELKARKWKLCWGMLINVVSIERFFLCQRYYCINYKRVCIVE